MDSLLICLLSIILTSHSLSEMKPEKILFSQLPPECAAEYDPFLRRERKAVSTDVIRIDLDDGVKVNYAKFQDVLAKIK